MKRLDRRDLGDLGKSNLDQGDLGDLGKSALDRPVDFPLAPSSRPLPLLCVDTHPPVKFLVL